MNTVEISRDDVTIGQELVLNLMPMGYSGQGGTVVSFDNEQINLVCGTGGFERTVLWSEVHHIEIEQALPAEDCLNFNEDCDGPVDWHTTGSSLKAWPRCDYHAMLRQNRYEDPNSSERYADSDVPPSDFHRSWGGANEYGEYWDEGDY